MEQGLLLRSSHDIGCHVQKLPTLLKTVQSIPDTKPYQIFLGNPTGSKINLNEKDLDATQKHVMERNLQIFVHTPYILNLCNDWASGWEMPLLKANLQGASRAGFRGVVIHVGKSVKHPLKEALANMQKNLETALEYATEECPLLLETPAGQGTETLTKCETFLEFVDEFKDKRLQVCLDTCHVFASGSNPLDYLKKAITHGTLKLVHYNDSKVPCGSCKDRHAFVGTGHIGIEQMTKIADLCKENGIPMVIE